jgi:hypothetical protein
MALPKSASVHAAAVDPVLLAGDRTILIGALAVRRGRRARRQSILSKRGAARAFWHGRAAPGITTTPWFINSI